jgi:putative redox protein
MNSKKISFKNKNGYVLSAHIEMPVDQHPSAFAIFAHCFTCSKNLMAVRLVTRSLTANGFGVLRFDFTGLGDSEGDFSDTNFTSNVDDLLAAAAYLKSNYEAPKLLIGHSLGGAAVIFASASLPEVEAVSIIGAPSGPDHVQHLLKDRIEEIESSGQATVDIGGRPFTVKKQFIDDVSNKNMISTINNLDKALLILHSPQDRIVNIENAKRIYAAAKHPKSFISLDGAGHLLMDKRDATYVGSVIASWAARYIPAPVDPPLKTNKQVLVRIGLEKFTTEILAGKHYLKADEPITAGGQNFGPTPYDLLLASLGACTAMTLRMYADRKKWDVEEIDVHLNYSKTYALDSENFNNKDAIIDKIDRCIEIRGSLDQKQLNRMLEIADKCPVHKTLHGDIRVSTELLITHD